MKKPLPTLALAALVLAATAAPAPLGAQDRLRLDQALERAERAAYANRIAAGQTRDRSGQALAPYRGILPSLRLESAYLRTTDPLNSFGFLLRQRAVTPAAFDPARLNDPAAIGNLMTGVVIEQPLFNADAWMGRSAAAAARDATSAAEAWTRSSTAVDVARAYYGAILAAEQVVTLRAASEAAAAHVRQAESMVRQGMATRSDALLAQVKAGEIEAQLLDAESNARLARRGLATLLGDPADTHWILPDSLPPAQSVRLAAQGAGTDSGGVADRDDVRAARKGQQAAEADARRATALYLPRVNGFGRVDWNSPDTPFGGKSAWTLGVMLSWSPFAGAQELAERRSASGRRESARAMAEAAEAQAGLELARVRDRRDVSLARLAIAERAVTQSVEAHRIVTRKYDGGLATISDLLDAGAMETATQLGHAAARYDVILAVAESRHAEGRDLSVLLELER